MREAMLEAGTGIEARLIGRKLGEDDIAATEAESGKRIADDWPARLSECGSLVVPATAAYEIQMRGRALQINLLLDSHRKDAPVTVRKLLAYQLCICDSGGVVFELADR